MVTPEERQQILDDEHLKIIRIGYFISGGAFAFTALFPLIYVVMGALIIMTARYQAYRSSGMDPGIMGWLFIIGGLVFSVGFGVLAALQILTAIRLKARRSRILCIITAALTCLFVPYHTALGVFTLMVLQRPSVKAMFEATQAPAITAPPAAPTTPGNSISG
jgi:hypothetical protein